VNIAGLILAAGASQRMGQPKPLLEFEGETFLERLARILSKHTQPVVVVLGFDAEVVLRRVGEPAGVVFVQNPHPERGQLSSMQLGLQALPDNVQAVLFTPVDHAPITENTVAALVAAFRDSGGSHPLVIPRWQGRRGHPVCMARELFADILGLPESEAAHHVIRAHQHRALYLDVDDSGVVLDVDDPVAYQQLVALRSRS